MSRLELYRPRQVSRWQRFADALRSYRLGPWKSSDKELSRWMGEREVSSGVSVNEDSALNYSAFWCAVELISGDIAKLPLPLYKTLENGGKELFRKHPLYRLLHDEPNGEMSGFTFRRTMQGHALVWRNAYAEIERDRADRPVALWPLLPNAVEPYRDTTTGPLKYRVWNPSGTPIEFDARNILHLPGLSPDGITGYNLVTKARESLGLSVATERFGATFFGNGSTFGGVITYPAGAAASPQARKDFHTMLESRHQGVDRAHRLLALYDGGDYTQIGVPPEAAQFLETRRFQVEEVARWFNIPVHKLKNLDRATNNNIEHQAIEYVTDTLTPWLKLWEQELNRKLIPRLERHQQFFEHITEGLLRGDSAAQGEFFGKLFSVGSITQNEIRAKLNLNPIANGDIPFVPSNMMPADLARQYWDAQIKSALTKAKPPKVPPSGEEHEPTDAEMKAFIAEIEARMATHAATVGDLSAAKAVADTRADTLQRERVALRAELQAAREVIATVTTERDAGFREREAAQTHCAEAERAAHEEEQRAIAAEAARDAQIAGRTAERDAQIAERAQERTAHESELTGLHTQRNELTTERDHARRETEEQRALLAAAEARVTTALAELDTTRTARDVAVLATTATTAQIGTLTTDRDRLQLELQARTSEAEALRQALETERGSARARRAVLMTAMRGLLVDTFERLLQREIDRARKAQGTPEKLQKWIEHFYPLHAEACRAALRPTVAAWATLIEGDAEALLERLVAGHVETSRVALRAIADVSDADEMAAALERTLRRWETERAGQVADALVKEGMAQHG